MKVLYCLGIREAWAMVEQALARLRADQLDLLLVYVINQPQRPDARPLLGG